MNIDKYYTRDGESIRKIIKRRRKDGLHLKVEKYFEERGYFIPEYLKYSNGTNSFLARHIATYKKEDLFFLWTSKFFKFTPIWSEYLSDKFVQSSKPKSCNLSLPINKSNGIHDKVKIKVACLVESEGKKLKDIETFWGENLVDFHHGLWDSLPGANMRKRVDYSEFLAQFGGAEEYYFYDLLLYLAHGVLFQDFHVKTQMSSEGSEKLQSIMESAFKKVEKIFGYKPLIYKFTCEEGYEKYPELYIPKNMR